MVSSAAVLLVGVVAAFSTRAHAAGSLKRSTLSSAALALH